jgi:hypothetical protein
MELYFLLCVCMAHELMCASACVRTGPYAHIRGGMPSQCESLKKPKHKSSLELRAAFQTPSNK